MKNLLRQLLGKWWDKKDKKDINRRKCLGHVKSHLKNSRLRKGWSEEQRKANLQEPVLDNNGRCEICGGY